MGKRRRQRRRAQRIWKHRRVDKSEFLLGVRQRLVNDVGLYFETIQRVREQTSIGIGSWALARMIFPVIEAVSTVVYRDNKSERKPVRLLRELGFAYLNLTWEMYRHTLTHNDQLAPASHRGRHISWEIGVGTGHYWSDGHLAIDAKRLYDDLLAYLEKASSDARNSQVHVWVKDSFRFNTAFGRATLDEAMRLGRQVESEVM